VHAGPAERVDAELEAGVADRLQIEHPAQGGDVHFPVLEGAGRVRLRRVEVREAPHAAQAVP
jgi:hypothetical protein